ncbi:MAG: DUF1015 family protein [Eubacteriaceae bacterium]|nr:DUF1015 family protein [Eubacteriaceae bacterium]
MPKAIPFRALMPRKDIAKDVSCLPYDTMSVQEAREMAQGNEHSFLRVIRSEICLEEGIDVYCEQVYSTARENLLSLVNNGLYTFTAEPAYIIYSQTMGSHTQTGVACLCSVQDYQDGLIKKHEHTLPEKELDRIRHFDAIKAQDEPVFFISPEPEPLEAAMQKAIEGTAPDFSFVDGFGIENSVWTVSSSDNIKQIQAALENAPAFYIADGHHRTQSAAATGDGTILAVVFPQGQEQIMGYHRLLSSISPYSGESFIEALRESFDVSASTSLAAQAKGSIGLYIAGSAYTLRPKSAPKGAVESLDCSIIQDLVFSKLLGIDDPKADKRLTFVGGIRGSSYLADQVDSGRHEAAICLYPPSFGDIIRITELGETMPPKSTWFEPKLRSGLFINVYKNFYS